MSVTSPEFGYEGFLSAPVPLSERMDVIQFVQDLAGDGGKPFDRRIV
ncbi:hypothetical protein AA23498_3602 [Acetobacter nitrogenifigens DSM 23921 = NBRC 105050]|uniref:Uncharacterized protein n=1 Tax=Acetobacter nitrogenifigens DSM 23921 = NBRC 105050 TaxID=1120919 RepID=A0A511XFH2_9PROT|nr:hypothetical protein [Acetobacter nitrogenifigens]GBR00045.1 hypothetical protein AA23498_3602 [Acetobacter nitrogenifigens DSM 23921 = NBRC 105050]GEN61678.1 hypothetical protein ANI02nite_35620 [Acetobacter nitrogenifigens DSM 23921 = NBRC 105050]